MILLVLALILFISAIIIREYYVLRHFSESLAVIRHFTIIRHFFDVN